MLYQTREGQSQRSKTEQNKKNRSDFFSTAIQILV